MMSRGKGTRQEMGGAKEEVNSDAVTGRGVVETGTLRLEVARGGSGFGNMVDGVDLERC
jgi:hypothetical protein